MNSALRRQMTLVAPRFKGQRTQHFPDFRESCQPPADWLDNVPPDDYEPPRTWETERREVQAS